MEYRATQLAASTGEWLRGLHASGALLMRSLPSRHLFAPLPTDRLAVLVASAANLWQNVQYAVASAYVCLPVGGNTGWGQSPPDGDIGLLGAKSICRPQVGSRPTRSARPFLEGKNGGARIPRPSPENSPTAFLARFSGIPGESLASFSHGLSEHLLLSVPAGCRSGRPLLPHMVCGRHGGTQ